jgi:serine/threonine-protein kinase
MDREPANGGARSSGAHEAETLIRPVGVAAPGSPAGITPPTAGVPPATESREVPSFPVSGWDRYELVGFLGEGGMGRVFSARDPRLGRDVALKFLKDEDAELARRFLVEARAQARVEHPAVCPVWEVGDVEGHLYIAMPLLKGRNLKDAARDMTLEQVVEVVARVADGLHAAHRIGLVHRDVKPGNVLVETTPDGERRPWVMDFGLVRDASVEGMTVTGLALGTPWYMPPEQALGRHAAIDRRSDVYSLGVTLYELLAGSLPFVGETPFDVMNRVLTEEPAPPSRHAPGLPADLETIVLKCLEKEPTRRYDSARALADDLRRFLDDEPIAARPTGPVARLLRSVRRNPALAILAAGLTLALVSFAAFAVLARIQSARRAEIARSLGEEVRETEILVRWISHLLPLHDVNRERAIVRYRMRDLEARLPSMGAAAAAPGAYALGRGHLVLGELDAARERLQRAWDGGVRTPEAAYALGVTLAHLYERERRAFSAAPSPEERERLRREADAALRDPALGFLEKARGARMDSPEYAEALVAELQGELDRAIELARSSAESKPWLYEARLLLGRALRRRGLERMEAGRDVEALPDWEAAEAAYRAAVEIARSAPDAYQGVCSLYRDRADAAQIRGRSATRELEGAARWCEGAVEADPSNALALLRASDVEWQWGIELASEGKDPRARFEKAVALAERTIPSRFDLSYALDNVGIARVNLAQWEAATGIDPGPSFAKAEEAFRRCTIEFPNLFSAHCNLAETLNAKARFGLTLAREPTALLAEARRTLERGETFAGHFCLALGWVVSASVESQWALLSGHDPTSSAEEAARRLELLRKVNPGAVAGLLEAATARLAVAEHRFLEGEAPTSELQAARRLALEASAASEGGRGAALVRAEVALLDARAGRTAAWAEAEEAFAEARRLAPASAHALSRSARFLRFRLDSRASRPDDARDGLRLARAALAIDPSSSEALLLAGLFSNRLGAVAEAARLTAKGSAANPLLPRLLGLSPPGRSGRSPSSPPARTSGPGGGGAAPPSP